MKYHPSTAGAHLETFSDVIAHDMVEVKPPRFRMNDNGLLEEELPMFVAQSRMVYYDEPKWVTKGYHEVYELKVTEE